MIKKYTCFPLSMCVFLWFSESKHQLLPPAQLKYSASNGDAVCFLCRRKLNKSHAHHKHTHTHIYIYID